MQVFAMPETSLGLFPDIGASYFLSRLPGFYGDLFLSYLIQFNSHITILICSAIVKSDDVMLY